MNGEGKNEDLTSEIHVQQLPTAAVTTVMVKVDGESRGLCVRSLKMGHNEAKSKCRQPRASLWRRPRRLFGSVCLLFLSDSS